jgi:hypothetical protein
VYSMYRPPFDFSTGATAWTSPQPVWGDCPAA